MNVSELIEWVNEQERTQGVSLATYELFISGEDFDEVPFTIPAEDVALSVRFSRITLDVGMVFAEVDDDE